MHIITDYIAAAVLLFFFFNGWRKGFFKTILGPITMIVGCVMGYLYYQKTHNMAVSLGICIISPFVINFLVSLVLKIWHKAVNDDAPLALMSRLFGGAFSLFWGSCYLIMTLILIGIVPIRIGWFEKVQDDVLSSKSYAFIDTLISEKMPTTVPDIKRITDILQNPAKLEKFQSTKEFKALSNDDQLRGLLADKETAEQIKNKDYGKLLANPKMQEVFQNQELLKKIFALNKKIMEENPEEEPGPKTSEIQPE